MARPIDHTAKLTKQTQVCIAALTKLESFLADMQNKDLKGKMPKKEKKKPAKKEKY